MNGVIVLDKPKGITSQQAVSTVNRILKISKSGHTGTLDPFATGVLPICINQATKIIPFMYGGFKKYDGVLELGISTDTLDATGKVIRQLDVPDLRENTVIDVFSKYKGKINQVPPMYSAIKKDGVRLYEYARKGIEVQRKPRTVLVKEIELLEFSPPYLRFVVECSRGTYIRVLASDIAEELGCGGHLKELRRTKSEGFTIDDAVTFEELETGSGRFRDLNEALPHLPRLNITDTLAKEIRDGRQLRVSHLDTDRVPYFKTGDRVKIYAGQDLVSITEAQADSTEMSSLDGDMVLLKLLRVFN
jgi:tRNA pseudouridine55 synthase